MLPIPIQKIVLYARPHVDNIAALFLLRELGRDAFPGIERANLEFWSSVQPGKSSEEYEAEGTLLIDMGGGRFDHHHTDHQSNTAKTTASQLVIEYLGYDQHPVFKRLLEFVRRDDIEGRGIVSKDPIDRAFGLPSIIMNLNRNYPEHPEYVVDMVIRIFQAWYAEEYRRKVTMPQEWAELQAKGLAKKLTIPTSVRPMNVILIQSDSTTIAGFLRAVNDIQADLVIQRTSTGHTNIISRQDRDRQQEKLNLVPLVIAIRKAEAKKKNMIALLQPNVDLGKPGRIEGLAEWYFDTAANTMQNGGASAQGVTPTSLTIDEIEALLSTALAAAVPQAKSSLNRGSRQMPQEVTFADLRGGTGSLANYNSDRRP